MGAFFHFLSWLKAPFFVPGFCNSPLWFEYQDPYQPPVLPPPLLLSARTNAGMTAADILILIDV